MPESSTNFSTASDGRLGAIDVHTHVFPDALAARAMEKLMSGAPECRAYSDGTRAGLIAQMDRAGVERAVVANIATKPTQHEAIFAFCEELAQDPRLIPFPSIFPRAPDAARWVRRAAERFAGLKCHPHYQDVQLDEPSFLEYLRAIRAEGLVLLMHAGRDPEFPGDLRAAPERLARMLDAVEGLRVILAHFGGWREWEAAARWIAGRPGVWLDTSASLQLMPRELALGIIEAHGPERMLFASDSPWEDIADERVRLESLGLSAATQARILRHNAASLLPAYRPQRNSKTASE